MRDPIQALMNAIERDLGSVAVVWCSDLGMRDWLVGEVDSLAPTGSSPILVHDVEAAISRPAQLALLVPDNERQTVLDLDASRDRLRGEEAPRAQPIVLFLLRGGDGERALAEEAVSLASWVGGNSADPEAIAQVDPELERAEFASTHGTTPERWLDGWREGKCLHTPENYRTAYRALLLEER